MTQEEEIKKFLLPYQTIFKMTAIGDYIDNTPLIPDTPLEPTYAWRALETECVYEGYDI